MSNEIGIVYATGEGQTEKIAGHIGRRLGRRAFDIDTRDVAQLSHGFDLSRYDGVIVGASVHAGNFPRRIARFVREHRDELGSKPSAFYSVSLTASDKSEEARQEIQDLKDRFLDSLQWQPDLLASFAGAIPFSRYGFIKRTIMKWVLRGRGEVVDTSRDYEYTDWADVDAMADQFATLVDADTEKKPPARP